MKYKTFIERGFIERGTDMSYKIRLYDASGKCVEGIIDNKKHTWRLKIRKNIIEFLLKILIYLLRKEKERKNQPERSDRLDGFVMLFIKFLKG